MKRFKLLLFALGTVLSLSAANYYASPTGTGDGSSYATPGSFASGRSKLSSIDTLYLLGGQYDLTAKITISQSGTVSRYKVIAAYPGEKPILDFRSEPYGAEITGSDNVGISISENILYVQLKGLTVRYAGKAGILNQGENCILENCEVYGCADVGIQMKKGGNNLIKNCDSHDNFDYKTTTTEGGINYGGNADGFADKQYTTPTDLNDAPNTYFGCHSWNNADDGWDFYQRIGSSVITECITYHNGPASFDMTNHPRRLAADSTWFKNFEGAGQTVTDRYGNTATVTVANYLNWGNGNGFKLGGGYTAHNITLNRCLAVENNVHGFDKNNNAGNMFIYNASAYDNGANYGFGLNTYANLTIKNSLSLATQSADFFQAITVVSDHNSWNTNGITCNNSDFLSLDPTLILAPRNADGSLPVNDFMRLADGSDLIDAGSDAKLPYSGVAPDLGCYEKGNIDQYPGIVSEASNKNQTITSGNAIADIVFTWSGGATGLTVTGLPAGITQTIDNTAQTLTLSGTSSAAAGTYTYTVYTVGGTAVPDSVSGVITIHSITSPSNMNQTIATNGTIANIIFAWVGDATGLTVTGLPAGITSTLDAVAQTLTISGTTTANVGTYPYTVTTVGGTGTDVATGSISVISPFNTSKYYNIYSYGLAANSSKTTASTSDAKQYITGETASIVLVAGLSDGAETTAGTPDSMRTVPGAEWIISKGTQDGFITARNRVSGKYLQVSSSLSSNAVEIIPVYKKDDNGKRAYAISTSATVPICLQVNPPSVNTFAGYADRTRMRWIFAEAEDIATGIYNTKIKGNFLKNTLVTNEIELLNPADFVSVEIINLTGQKLSSNKVSAATINISGLSTGVYLAKGIAKNGELYLSKIVKK